MKRILLTAFLGMSALIVSAQQWNGSTTVLDTIYRHGMVRMMPETTGVPFSEWDTASFKVYRYNNSDWRWEWVSVEWDGIHMGRNVPAPSNSTRIGHGDFYFSNFYTSGTKYLKYAGTGILESNGKIITTDSVVAQNIKATNAVKASFADIPTISGSTGTFSTKVTAPTIAVNNTSVPTNFKFGVTGKSYFSDFVE